MFDGLGNVGFPKLEGGANTAGESFSSATEQVVGGDGKVHKKSRKMGSKMKC
jgi:hypothetical protein